MPTTYTWTYTSTGRLEPGVPTPYRFGPLRPEHKNAVIAVNVYPEQGLGSPYEPLSVSVQETTIQMVPPRGDQMVWLTLVNTARIPINFYRVRVSAIVG